MKYRPGFLEKPFDSLENTRARTWVAEFQQWYNEEHRHRAIKFVTPGQRHRGEDVAIPAQRHILYETAGKACPERWSRHTRNWTPLGAVALNNPQKSSQLDRVINKEKAA